MLFITFILLSITISLAIVIFITINQIPKGNKKTKGTLNKSGDLKLILGLISTLETRIINELGYHAAYPNELNELEFSRSILYRLWEKYKEIEQTESHIKEPKQRLKTKIKT